MSGAVEQEADTRRAWPAGVPVRDDEDGGDPFGWPLRATSVLTDHAPRAGSRLLDALASRGIGSALAHAVAVRAARTSLERVRAFDRVLVVADLNIGDAVMAQAAITALREYVPDAQVSYAVARAARPLLEGNADVTTLHAVLEGAGAPRAGNAAIVRRITASQPFDVVFNFCPFLPSDALAPPGTPVVGLEALAAEIVRAVRDPAAIPHVVLHMHRVVHALLAPERRPRPRGPFTGVAVWLSDAAVRHAARYLRDHDLGRGIPLVVVNPDASSRFTRLPFDLLTATVRGLVRLPCAVVLGAGHADRGVETRLLAALAPAERRRVCVLPASMPLDGYAAVVDAADVYLTGDTGPLHVAAARKRSGDGGGAGGFRNRTAVISVFGATPPRLYGYASERPGFFAANQDAPSFVHVCASPCRNLTCAHKTAKTCHDVRCFDGPDVAALLAVVARCLRRVAPAGA